jgi:uncharacterized membrane protein YfcA
MTYLWLSLAAIAAGAMNAIAGGGTLITFPTLNAVLTPTLGPLALTAANITSCVAVVPGSIGGVWGFRRELRHCGRWIAVLTLPSLVGGTIGSLLLMELDPKIFGFVVPWLVLLAAVLFLMQPRIAKWVQAHRGDGPPSGRTLAGIIVMQVFIAIYGGYFGAGIGILMLSTLGFLGLPSIHAMNALKSYLATCINGISVVFFLFSGQIQWPMAIVMAVACILGGYVGAVLSLRLKPVVVRWIVIVIGFGLAAYFFWKQYS